MSDYNPPPSVLVYAEADGTIVCRLCKTRTPPKPDGSNRHTCPGVNYATNPEPPNPVLDDWTEATHEHDSPDFWDDCEECNPPKPEAGT